MLKTVIQQKYIDRVLGFQAAPGCKPIGTDTEQNIAAETTLEQVNFVAAAVRASVTAAENGYSLSLCQKLFGEPQNHGSFAGSADSHLPNADYGCFQAL